MPGTRDRTLTVIGSTSVGKSALTIRFVKKQFTPEYDPTISRTYRHHIVINGTDYSLTVYDTAGLEQQAQIPQYYINSHGFILVYSIADPQSFEIVRDIYDRLVDEIGSNSVPVVLIGNKFDLNDQRRVNKEAGQQLVQEWRNAGSQAAFIETSALTGEKVDDVFVTLLNLMDRPTGVNNQNNKNTSENSNQRLSNEKPTSEKKCVIS